MDFFVILLPKIYIICSNLKTYNNDGTTDTFRHFLCE